MSTTTLTGADAAARADGKNLQDKGITHDFHGFTTGCVPDGSTHKFGQITVVEHSDVVDRLAMTKNGQLLYRMLPVHADAFDLLAELTNTWMITPLVMGNPSLHLPSTR